jgi:hypothetical protein
MKYLLMLMLCLTLFCCVSCKDATTQPDIEGLFDLVPPFPTLEGTPDKPTVYAIFFKIHDDIPRVLVTGGEWLSRRSHGWEYYCFMDGQWQKGSKRIVFNMGPYVEPSVFIEAGFYDFYMLTEEGSKPKFVVITKNSFSTIGKRGEEDICIIEARREAHHITLDAEGYLITIPIPDFTIRLQKIYEDEFDYNEFFKIELKSPNDKLEPVNIEVFNPR